MATYKVGNLPDGSERLVELPEGASQDEIIAEAMKQVRSAAAPRAATAEQQSLASGGMRLLKGMKDPIDAAAQLLPRAGSFVSSGAGFFPNSVSKWFDEEAAKLDQDINLSEQEYQAARKATGNEGVDWWRMGGNVVSPVNVAVASRLGAPALTAVGRAWTGAKVGGVAGAMQPVTDTSESSFAVQKGGQTALGAAGGALLGPALGWVADKVTPRVVAFLARFKDPVKSEALAMVEASKAIDAALKEAGIEDLLPPDVRSQVAREIIAAARQGKKLDPAAVVRKADFERVGLPWMGPQVSRDPAEFSRMMNLRGVQMPGDKPNPIQMTIQAQSSGLADRVSGYGGPRAAEPEIAGRVLASTLKEQDKAAARGVSKLYTAVREGGEAAADIPAPGLADAVGKVVERYGAGSGKHEIPSAVLSRLKSFGFVADDGMTQRKVFNFDAAEDLLQQINENGIVSNNGLKALSRAIKEAISTSPKGVDPFSGARAAAAARFKLNDAVPALKAVSEATSKEEIERIGDEFVKKFILNAKPSDVRRLAEVLPGAQKEEARKQIARIVYQKFFGKSGATDSAAAPERAMAGLEQIGFEKMRAFFSPKEIDDMKTMARIAAYMWRPPAAATVSGGSNLGGAMTNDLLNLVPGRNGVIGSVLQAPVSAGMRAAAIRQAMKQQIPMKPNLTAEQERLLSDLLGMGTFAGSTGGLLSIPQIGQ